MALNLRRPDHRPNRRSLATWYAFLVGATSRRCYPQAMRLQKTIFIALALLGITCTGCDDELGPQHGGATTVTYRAPGEVWGPCKENCADGFCIHEALGSACFPPCGPICGDIVDMCGTVIGNGTCLDSGLCALVCLDTPDCPSGMVCSPNAGLCLWPD